MLITVEKRRRPIWIGNTGVFVSCTMACTAKGIDGVPVTELVSVAAGDGVSTKNVAVAGAAVAVLVAEAGTLTVADGETWVWGSVLGVDAGDGGAGRLATNRIPATMTEKKPATNDQRARAT